MTLPPAPPAGTVDVPAMTATEDASTDGDDDFLVLNRDQLQEVQLFRDHIRACKTDDEKYGLCAKVRDDLLDRHTGLEFLVAAYHHVMQVECADYETWRAGGAIQSKQQTKRKRDADDDAAQWECFVGVVQSGTTIKVRCLRPLKTVSRFWGRHRVQHYEWGSKGARYCEVLCSAAHAVHDWDEAATKLCWIILRRLRRPGSRGVRDSVNSIDQIDLVVLKAWSHRGPFVNPKYPNEDPIPFRPITANDLPAGFGIDRYKLMVQSKYAVVEPNSARETVQPVRPPAANPDAMDITSSTPNQELQPSATTPVASDSTLNEWMDIVNEILDESPNDHLNGDPRDGQNGSGEDHPATTTQTELPVHIAANTSATVDPVSANYSARELRPRPQKPDYREPAPAAASKPKKTPQKPTNIKVVQRRCCPPEVPSDFLLILDKPSAFRFEAVEKYAPCLKKLCHKHLQKSAELAFAQKRDYPTPFDNHSSANPFSAATTTIISDPLPIPTRSRAASLPDITHQLPAFKRQRLNTPNPLPIQLPNPPPINPQDELHDREADHAYLEQARAELLQKLHPSRTVPNSHGERNNKLVYAIFRKILQPNTDKHQGVVEAYFCTDKEAASRLEAGFPDGPIFAQAHQQFQWSAQDRPIVQLFHRVEDLESTVPVQIPSRSATGKSSDKRKLSQILSRFLQQQETDDPWNVGFRSPLPPSILPPFLTGANCQLLHRIQDALLMGNAPASPEQWKELRDVLDSVLVTEGGHNTPPTTGNLATWITVQEGRLGFAWMSRPTQDEQDKWMADPHNSAIGRWRYVILRPGQTVAFNSGTIRFLFNLRSEQTLALRGHFLQWSGVDRWLQIVNQTNNPSIANEDVKWSAQNYVRIVESLIKRRQNSGRIEELGGESTIARFLHSLEEFKKHQQSQRKA